MVGVGCRVGIAIVNNKRVETACGLWYSLHVKNWPLKCKNVEANAG